MRHVSRIRPALVRSPLFVCVLALACSSGGGGASTETVAPTCSVPEGKYCLKSLRTSCPATRAAANCVIVACTGDETYAVASSDRADTIAYSKKGARLVPTTETATAIDVTDKGLSIVGKSLCAQNDEDGTVLFKGSAQSVSLLALNYAGTPAVILDSSLKLYPDVDSPAQVPVEISKE